ncbi:RNA binding domain containing protein [Blumeria hordei DH14]|uniref:RNA binding domain containing protein n=1 Tax=Blumeria graminis f. sp. hordei (strain DH14) TaxID=546991 RepID=N1JGM4_BLUG1|nr:RNA binding domain containing protein [Blumeria hordei DH14]
MFPLRRALLRASGSSASIVTRSRNVQTPTSFALGEKLFQNPFKAAVLSRFSSDYSQDNRSQDYRSNQSGSLDSSDQNRYNSQTSNNSRNLSGGESGGPPDLLPSASIYVGNIIFDLTAERLEQEFSQYGTVKSATIATDARGLSKGFGYVEFESVKEAEAAISGKNQTELEGRRMIVNFQAKSKRSNKVNPPSNTLFVGNLAFEMTDSDLNKLFKEVRNVIDVRVAVDRRTGQPRGFAHAEFVSIEDAIKAKEQLTGKELFGRELRLDFSTGVRGTPSTSSS